MTDTRQAREALDTLQRHGRLDLIPLSSVQRRMWLAERNGQAGTAYHIARSLTFDGRLDADRLARAIAREVDRHEGLRTGILVVDGRPVQRVNPAEEAPRLEPVDVTETDAEALADELATRPFPMDGRPLVRFGLFRLTATRHRLVLVVHHLVADAASLDIVLDGLTSGYARDGRGEAFPEPPPYRAFLRSTVRTDDETRAQVEAWAAELRGATPLRLTSRAAVDDGVRGGEVLTTRLPAHDTDGARSLSRTLTPCLLAAYAVVLHRFAQQDDIVVGLPVSARTDGRFARTVGLFVSTLPIRVRLGDNPTLREAVRRVERAMLDAIARADAPLDEVVRELRLPREAGRDPLFDATLGVLAPTSHEWTLDGLTVTLHRHYGGQAKFDLHLEALDAGGGADVVVTLEHDPRRLADGLAQAVLDGVGRVLAAMATEPEHRVGAITLTDDADTVVGGDPSVDPSPTSPPRASEVDPSAAPAREARCPRVDEVVRAVAARRPDALAVRDTTGRRLTYAELVAGADAFAARLHEAGARAGDAVALALPRCADLVLAELGTLVAGCHYVPIDTAEPDHRISHMLASAGVRLVVTDADAQPTIDASWADRLPVVPMSRVEAAPPPGAPVSPHALDGEAAAYVMFTSGSTGLPKPVVVPHRGVTRLAHDARLARGTWLHVATPVFDAATLEVWTPLLRGDAVVVLVGRPSVHEIGAAIRTGVDVAFFTSGLLDVIADEDIDILRPLTQVTTGGDVLSPRHAQRVLDVVGDLLNAYGPTENTVAITSHRMRSDTPVPAPVPVGRALPGTEVAVVDQYGHRLPPGVEGEIVVAGEGLAHGYRGDPRRTAVSFVPCPWGRPGRRAYRTGDIGRLDRDGLLHFVGRRDHQVKVRGFRVELPEIERAAEDVAGVESAAVALHRDTNGDKGLVGFYVGATDARTLSDALVRVLPAHLRPGRWLRLPALPLGATGKVDRAALVATLADAPDLGPATDELAAGSLVDRLLTGWYTELLGSADVGPGTDFFRAGGHSLLASRLVARVRATLELDLPLSVVFANPRLGDLASVIRSGRWRGARPITALPSRRGVPLSPAQERMWFLEQLDPGSPTYHVPLRLRLVGDIDAGEVRQGLERIVRRHAALRTVVATTDDGPTQSVLDAADVLLETHSVEHLDAATRAAAVEELVARTIAQPFDLGRPALRGTLVRLDETTHDLVLVFHHIAVDGWSAARLLDDLVDTDGPDPASALTYADVAAWQRDWLDGPAGERLERFWSTELEGAPTRVPEGLVADGGRSSEGSLVRFGLGATHTTALRETCSRHGLTPFAALLTVFAATVAGRLGRSELLVGTPVANRTDPATLDLVGPFVNTVPVRCRFTGGESYAAAARRVSSAVARAIGHADLPFERIVEAVGVERRADEHPLVQVIFALQPAIGTVRTWGAARAELVPVHTGTSKVDLTMSLFDDGDDIVGYVEHRIGEGAAAAAKETVAAFVDGVRAAVDGDRLAGLDDPTPSTRTTDENPASGRAARAQDEPEPVATGLVDVIAGVWSQVLGTTTPPRPGDDFFALGGHSLAATRVVSRVRRALGREVPLRALFDHPTLAGFSGCVEGCAPARPGSALRPTRDEGPAPLSPAQERLWVRHQLAPDSDADVVPVVLRLGGHVDRARLEQALTLLAVRHPILRTTFPTTDGVPRQVVADPEPVRVETHAVAAGADVLTALGRQAWVLEREPAWGTHLLMGGDGQHLVLVLHHLLVDGWSVSVLLRDLSALLADPHAPLPPLPVQFADYARWLGTTVDPSTVGDLADRLRDVPDLDLPTDRPREGATTGRAADRPLAVSPALRARLEALAVAHGGTLFSALLTVQVEMLHRYAGQDTFAVATHHAGRTDPATEGVVGNFVNTLVVPCDASGLPTWRTLLGRTARAVAVSLEHAEVPFERVLERLDRPRDLDRTPVFQTMCVLQNLPERPTDLAGVPVEHVRQPYDYADVDLALWWAEDGNGGLRGGLTYDTALFDTSTAEELGSLVEELLAALVDGPDEEAGASARAVALPPAAEPRPVPLLDRWADVVRARADATAVTWQDDAGRVTEATYAEIDDHARRLGIALRRLGVGPEARVAVLLPRSADAVAAYLGVMRAGGAYVPVDPDQPRERIAMLLDLAGPHVIVTDAEGVDLAHGRPTLDVAHEPEDAPPDEDDGARPAAGSQLAYVIFTSGSTGTPKAVMVSRDNLDVYLAGIGPELGLGPEDRVLNFASVGFDATTEEVYPVLLAGGAVVLRPRALRVPDEDFDAFLERTRPTVLSLPVTFWQAWSDRLCDNGSRVPEQVRSVLLNAEEPSVAGYERWWEGPGARTSLVNTYGPTEGTVTASLYRPDPAPGAPSVETAARPGHQVWRRFPVGHPLATMSMVVLDGRGRPMPRGAVGELVIGGGGVTRGYHGRAAATADVFRPDPGGPPGARRYHTGDLARQLSDGSFLLLGRIDRQLKVRGHRVEPGEVEALLTDLEEIVAAAVVARVVGQVTELVAFVVSDDATLDPLALRSRLLGRVPDHLVPARLVQLAALPLTHNGKVDYAALSTRAVTEDPTPAAATALTPLEQEIQAVWQEVLARSDIGPDDGFFALGGDSIRALVAVTRAKERGIQVTLRELFRHQSVRALAAALTTAPTDASSTPGDASSTPGDAPPRLDASGPDAPRSLSPRQVDRAAALLRRRTP